MRQAKHFEPFKELYDRGTAVGEAGIRSDTMFFRFRKEEFEFPTIQVIPEIAKWNGYFYEAKISDLRKLKKKNGRS